MWLLFFHHNNEYQCIMSHPEKTRFVPLVGIKSLFIVLDFINTISF